MADESEEHASENNSDHSALARPVVMPETFSGTGTERFRDWLNGFDMCSDINDWDTEMRRNFFDLSPRCWAQSLCQSRRGDEIQLRETD